MFSIFLDIHINMCERLVPRSARSGGSDVPHKYLQS